LVDLDLFRVSADTCLGSNSVERRDHRGDAIVAALVINNRQHRRSGTRQAGARGTRVECRGEELRQCGVALDAVRLMYAFVREDGVSTDLARFERGDAQRQP